MDHTFYIYTLIVIAAYPMALWGMTFLAPPAVERSPALPEREVVDVFICPYGLIIPIYEATVSADRQSAV